MKNIFAKKNLKDYLKKYRLAVILSFMIGVIVPSIPYAYKFINSYRMKILIQKERELQIIKKELKCKNEQSDYTKFINLGFPNTAMKKFNICMQEK